MASTAPELTTHPVTEQALAGLERGRRLLYNTFKYVPEEKLTWAPSETAKCALHVAAHCVIVNYGIANLLKGEGAKITTFADLFAISAAKEKEFTDKQQVLDQIEASTQAVGDAIRAVPAEGIEAMVGHGELQSPAAFYMNLAGMHMAMHSAQIDYLQTTWGDCVPHFGG